MRPAALVLFGVFASVSSALAQPRVVVVEETPESPEPGRVETASELYRMRLGGLFEGALGRDQYGNAVGLPRLRLRAEALVSMTLEVGMVAELDVSPWSSPNLKEDGPGIFRDLYGRMALGNKKILDLGEARLGYFTAPILAEQWQPQQEALFLTGTLAREAWLPGRELAASYDINGYRWAIPVRGVFALTSGVRLGNAPIPSAVTEPHPGATTNAAQGVPLTAGTTFAAANNPGLSGRVEVEPLRRWSTTPFFLVGAGMLVRPLSTGPDARGALAVDAQLRWKLFQMRAAAVLADTQRAPFADSRAFSVESALQFIPDFADVRVRYDVAYGPAAMDAQRLHLGMALFYLDGAAPGPLTASPLPLGPAYGRAFTILWVRTYDLMRYAPGYGNRAPIYNPADRVPTVQWGLDQARWVTGGDTDQLVIRVAF